jgi:hypothetical protein
MLFQNINREYLYVIYQILMMDMAGILSKTQSDFGNGRFLGLNQFGNRYDYNVGGNTIMRMYQGET